MKILFLLKISLDSCRVSGAIICSPPDKAPEMVRDALRAGERSSCTFSFSLCPLMCTCECVCVSAAALELCRLSNCVIKVTEIPADVNGWAPVGFVLCWSQYDWAVSHPKIPPGLTGKLSPKQSHSWDSWNHSRQAEGGKCHQNQKCNRLLLQDQGVLCSCVSPEPRVCPVLHR